MLLIPNQDSRLPRLAGKLRLAETVTPDLVTEIISAACTRMPSLNKSGPAAVRFDRLKQTSAWTDFALALIELERPAWKPRRLVYENGAWCCSLSMQPNVPLAVDDTVDASHENLPLAILSAFVEACERRARATSARTVPQIQQAQGEAVCCDNYA